MVLNAITATEEKPLLLRDDGCGVVLGCLVVSDILMAVTWRLSLQQRCVTCEASRSTSGIPIWLAVASGPAEGDGTLGSVDDAAAEPIIAV